jgi:hypothetical protein
MKKIQLLIGMLLIIGIIAVEGSAAATIKDTKLFVTVDTHWEHAHDGDAFVVRADVKNIGDYPALLTRVRLQNIPSDWKVRPHQQFILVLKPGQTRAKFFVIERGPTDSTIYAAAHAYNAPTVVSNRIAIPISLWVVAALCIVCGVFFYREAKTRKK